MNKEIKKKSKETLFDNYGVDSPLQNKKLLEKFKKTMLERYGYEHWLQDVDNFEYLLLKSKSYKKYILEDGRKIHLQGYEDYALFEILLKKYKPSDIIINTKDINKKIGKIEYINNGSTHRYYPDFYIKSENKIIEIKGEYTYNTFLEINLLKQKSCLGMDLRFEFIIIDKKIYKKWKTKNK